MSVESMSVALRLPGLPPAEKLLLVGIANHDGDGGAWPSTATLATYVGVSVRQVQKLLRKLEERGLVTVELQAGGTVKMRADQRPNLYHLHLERGVAQDAPSNGRGEPQDTPRGELQDTPPVSPRTPETSLNRPVNQTPASAKPKPEANCIVDDWWESLDVKPAQPYVAIVKIVERCLKSGWSAELLAAALREAPTVSGASFDLWRNTREKQAPASDAWITELLSESTAFFEKRDLLAWRHANVDALRATIRTLGAWGFDRGETMIRIAVGARRPSDLTNPSKLSNLPRIDRFQGMPDDLSESMERAYRNLAWKAS